MAKGTVYFCGHSMGGAIATIMYLMANYDRRMFGRKIKCIAFSPPPSISTIPYRCYFNLVSFTIGNDVVPYLSAGIFSRESEKSKNQVLDKLVGQVYHFPPVGQLTKRYIDEYLNDPRSRLDLVIDLVKRKKVNFNEYLHDHYLDNYQYILNYMIDFSRSKSITLDT